MGLGFLTQSSGDEKLMRFKDKNKLCSLIWRSVLAIGGSAILELFVATEQRCIPDLYLSSVSKDFIGDNDL